jgi:hypothetical protein
MSLFIRRSIKSGGIAWAENFGRNYRPIVSAEQQPKISGSNFEPENFG